MTTLPSNLGGSLEGSLGGSDISTVMLVVDEPAVLLVVSSSLGGEVTTISLLLLVMLELLVLVAAVLVAEDASAGDGERASGIISTATAVGEFDAALLKSITSLVLLSLAPMILVCFPFHTFFTGRTGDGEVLTSDTTCEFFDESSTCLGWSAAAAGVGATSPATGEGLDPKMLSFVPFQAMVNSCVERCG